MDETKQMIMVRVAAVINPIGRSLGILMLLVGGLLAILQDDRRSFSFQFFLPVLFFLMGIVVLIGFTMLLLSVFIRCSACGRRGTIFTSVKSVNNGARVPHLSARQQALAFFWPTRASFGNLRCNKCGQAFLSSENMVRQSLKP
jgi:hypothetical protein